VTNEKYVRNEIELQSTPTRRIKAIVTIPTNTKTKAPGVVCIHGHGGNRGIVYDRTSLYRGFATELAERGFATISTDVGQHEVYEPKRTLMGERLWTCSASPTISRRCPKWMPTNWAVPAYRLAAKCACGSGPWTRGMKATVSSGFLTTVANMRDGHCMCWDFPGLTENFDFSDIYSLTAPRALQCQNGQREPARGGFPVKTAKPGWPRFKRPMPRSTSRRTPCWMYIQMAISSQCQRRWHSSSST